jgi:hypothetical protein
MVCGLKFVVGVAGFYIKQNRDSISVQGAAPKEPQTINLKQQT